MVTLISPYKTSGIDSSNITYLPQNQYRYINVKQFRPLESVSLEKHLKADLKGLAEAIISTARLHNLDPAFLAAVCIHETGNGDVVVGNNILGVMEESNPNKLKKFNSREECLDFMAKILASPQGPYEKRKNIIEIQQAYAPIGVSNDPNGLNRHWVLGVERYFSMIISNASIDESPKLPPEKQKLPEDIVLFDPETTEGPAWTSIFLSKYSAPLL